MNTLERLEIERTSAARMCCDLLLMGLVDGAIRYARAEEVLTDLWRQALDEEVSA